MLPHAESGENESVISNLLLPVHAVSAAAPEVMTAEYLSNSS